jgi:regulator of protease activity HflC (stomatin/prohibitin superfamily)
MRQGSSFPVLVFLVIVGIGVGLAYAVYSVTASLQSIWIGVIALAVAAIVSSAIQIANQWEKAVVLRLGHFRSLQGPGLFFIIPIIDTIPYWIDTRVITGSFKAEKTLQRTRCR